jgi:plastocyanin
MNTDFRKRRRGILAATSALVVAAGIAVVSVAGAAQEVTVYSAEANGPCFTTTQAKPACDAGERPTVTIETGDTVTFDLSGTPSGQYHNAAAANDVTGDATWKSFSSPYNAKQSRRFDVAGTYQFKCTVHVAMTGTIVVEGDPVEPSVTATATATASATPTFASTPPASATATPDDHTSTPAPGHAAAKDAEAPRLQRASVKRIAAGARLRFWLSEPATVAIDVVRKGARSSATSAVVQAPAGTRTFVLRTRALRKGTYTVTLSPTDAMGNKGARGVKTLKVAR